MKIKYGKLLGTTLISARYVEYSIRVFPTGSLPLSNYPIGHVYGGAPALELLSTGASINATNYSFVHFVDSSNTLGSVVDGTTSGVILWNPYKREAIAVLKEPVLRRYNPPRFSKRRPVLRLPDEPTYQKRYTDEQFRKLLIRYEDAVKRLELAFEHRLHLYETKLNRFVRKKSSYDAQYSRSVVRFKRRLNLYLSKLLTLQGAGIKRYKSDMRYAQGTLYSLFEINGTSSFVMSNRYRTTPPPAPVNPEPNIGCGWSEYDDDLKGAYAYTTASIIEATSFLSDLHDTRLKSTALRRLQNGNVEGGILLGESKETADLLIQLFKFLRHLKSNPSKAISDATKLRELNNLYLANHFGIQPLFDDMKRLVRLLGTGIQTSGDVRCKTMISFPLDQQYIPLASGFTVSGRLDIYRTYKYSIDNPFLRILETLGLLNPLSIAWELVPLSFVADWFYNIGDYLAAQTATSGLKPLEAWETLDIRGYASTGAVPISVSFGKGPLMPEPPYPGVWDNQRTVSFSNAPIRLKYRRKILTDLDPEIPHVRLGDWPLSKLVTSLSLILQRVL